MTRLTFAFAFVALQTLGFLVWTIYEQARLAPGSGESILVRTAPVDPRDLLRGQYMRLRYPFNQASDALDLQPNQTVWVLLRPQSNGEQAFHAPVDYSTTKPTSLRSGDVLIRGRAERGRRVVFGIEKYFVPEGTPTPNQRDVTVRLRVGEDHRPRLEAVYVRGVLWP